MVPRNYGKAPKAAKGSRGKGRRGRGKKKTVEEDKSVLRQPIDTGVKGVKDLVKALAGGTAEFQDLLMNECSVIYECKVCSSLFRSLANFISHKRVYCIRNYSQFSDNVNPAQSESQSQPLNQTDIMVIPEMPLENEQNLDDADTWVTSDKTCDSESVMLEELQTLTPRKKMDYLKLTKKRDLTEVLEVAKKKREKEVVKKSDAVPDSRYYADMAQRMLQATPDAVVELESMSASSTSVFQTLKMPDHGDSVDSMRVQLLDLDRISSRNQATLLESGKFVVTSERMETEEERNLEKYYCTFCESSFLTQQSLLKHIDTYHTERICYPCPLCKIFLASPTSVYRHLSKGHHKSEQQIRRLRPQVLLKARKLCLQNTNQNGSDNPDNSKRSTREADGQWGNNEGELCCKGCGRVFNRRAVLNVHTMTCRKMEALLRASESTNKAKSTSKTSAKSVSPGKNSESVVSSRLPESGILVRKDYGKIGNTKDKPHSSSRLTEARGNSKEARGSHSSRYGKSSKPIGRAGPGLSKSNYSDKMSTSSDNSSVAYSNSSQRSSAKKKRYSSDEAELKKGNKKGGKKNF